MQIVVLIGFGMFEFNLLVGLFIFVFVEVDEELEVIVDYDKVWYCLIEEFVEIEGGDWIYCVKFLLCCFVMFGVGFESKVEICVFKGYFLSIVGEVKMGQVEMDFGGFVFKVVDLEIGMGEFEFEVSELIFVLVESFNISGCMGQLIVDFFGNVSFVVVELCFCMGEVSVDFEGIWCNDLNISICCSMGECGVCVLEDVFVDVDVSVVMGGCSVCFLDQSVVFEGVLMLVIQFVVLMGEVCIW